MFPSRLAMLKYATLFRPSADCPFEVCIIDDNQVGDHLPTWSSATQALLKWLRTLHKQ